MAHRAKAATRELRDLRRTRARCFGKGLRPIRCKGKVRQMHEPQKGWGDGEKELEKIVVKKVPRLAERF